MADENPTKGPHTKRTHNARFQDLTGQQFGRLTVLYILDADDARYVRWHCQCECGNECTVLGKNLRRAGTRSCGCLLLDFISNLTRTHGYVGTRTYRSWAHMKGRSENPKDAAFEDYGGRGITLCERWRVFENFLADMGECPKGMSIERVDNALGYCPENCKWGSRTEQARNKRNNRVLTYHGHTHTVVEWAERTGLMASTISTRLNKLGWSIDDAITRPLRRKQ